MSNEILNTINSYSDWIKEYRKGHNVITGELNQYKDITDQMIWNAAQKVVINKIKKIIDDRIAILNKMPKDDFLIKVSFDEIYFLSQIQINLDKILQESN